MRLFAWAALTAVTLICAPARAADNDATVPTYHADAARSAHYVVPGLTWTNAGEMRRDEAFDGKVPGHIYAQPLYCHPSGATRGLVIVATEENVVAALDAARDARSGNRASVRPSRCPRCLVAISTRSVLPARL